MKPIMVTHLLISFLLFAASCDEPDQPLPDPGPDTVATDSTFIENFHVEIPNRTTGAINCRKIFVYEGNMIQITDGNTALVTCFDGKTGQVKWQWIASAGISSGENSIKLGEHYLALCLSWKTVVVLDARNGQVIWQNAIPNNAGTPRIAVFGGYVYHQFKQGSSQAKLIRSPLDHCQWETVFQLGMTGEFTPDLEMPCGWVNASGDTLLYFQNRTGATLSNTQTWQSYTELFCLNISTDSLVWRIPMLTPDGETSVRPPYIYQQKLYFLGAGGIYCLNPLSGEQLWVKSLNQTAGVTENLWSSGLAFADGKIAYAPGNKILYCVNAQNGQTLWQNTEAGQSFDLSVWDKKIWYGAGIFDHLTGKRLFSESGLTSGYLAVDSVYSRVFVSAGATVYGYQYQP